MIEKKESGDRRMEALDYQALYNSDRFRRDYDYDGGDLGAIIQDGKTYFRIWSPVADAVELFLYRHGDYAGNTEVTEEKEKGLLNDIGQFSLSNQIDELEQQDGLIRSVAMKKEEKGVWTAVLDEEADGIYYNFKVTIDGKEVRTADPYARAAGVNGVRSMVLDHKKASPEGWDQDCCKEEAPCPVIYELHVRDFSYQEESGVKKEYRGTYLAFTQEGTTLSNDNVHPTGVDYLKKLGVTHVHLLPSFDFASIDEGSSREQFNWGYDPVNYNVPEGSYSTNAHDGHVRVLEFKQMVMALHKAGIRVVMDVVYNHTHETDSWLNRTVPYYYYRLDEQGEYSNGSSCGNETASERPMMARYMVDSVVYWAKEYHIDGFRFDLMGIHDTDTMNQIRKALNELPQGEQILMYGEPWFGGSLAMPEQKIPAIKRNVEYLDNGIAIFCDNTRDAIKGDVFIAEKPGYVNGADGMEEKIASSIAGWCGNWQCKEEGEEFAPHSTSQIISYVSAHDNFTLWDKLKITMCPKEAGWGRNETLIKANKLSAAILMMCQGKIFFQAGEEFGRTKEGDENSYASPSSLNALDWKRSVEFADLVSYYSGLIAIRKKMPLLYDGKTKTPKQLSFLPSLPEKVVAFSLKDEDKQGIFAAYNASSEEVTITLPEGMEGYVVLADKDAVYEEGKAVVSEKLTVPAMSACILGKNIC
ncbi:MAG: type I pullulanase [Clostridiales bacterium]|nr:type I pullulanase [Clostridiales bacterium]